MTLVEVVIIALLLAVVALALLFAALRWKRRGKIVDNPKPPSVFLTADDAPPTESGLRIVREILRKPSGKE